MEDSRRQNLVVALNVFGVLFGLGVVIAMVFAAVASKNAEEADMDRELVRRSMCTAYMGTYLDGQCYETSRLITIPLTSSPKE